MTFEFQSKWKEELQCTCPLGTLSFDWVGAWSRSKIYLPSEAGWKNMTPEWAHPYYREIFQQLADWLLELRKSGCRVTVVIEDFHGQWDKTT